MAITFSSPERITSSRGKSRFPSLATDPAGNMYVAFQDDRVRSGYPDVYLARYDAGHGIWQSSNHECDDTKIESYVTAAEKPAAALDVQGNIAVLFEQTKDGEGSKVGLVVHDGTLVTIDENVSAHYPLNDRAADTRVKNKACFFDGPPSDPQNASVHGIASTVTAALTDSASISQAISLANPADQAGFRLNLDNEWFKADTSILSESGGVDMWVRPLVASTDPQTKYFFGNAAIGATTPDTISFAQDSGDLKLRLIDSSGLIHQTTVDSADYSWAANDWVHLRATWDRRGSDATRNTSVCFPTAAIGYSCGHGGNIYKTTDGGLTWSKMTTGVTYDLYSIDFATPTDGWACGERGTILRTLDGTNWQIVDLDAENDLRSIVVVPGSTAGPTFAGVLVVVGTEGFIRYSSDGGTTWTAPTMIPETTSDFYGVCVFPGGTNYRYIAVGEGGQMYRSGTSILPAAFGVIDSGVTEDLWSISRGHPAYRVVSEALPGLDPFTIPSTAWTLYACGTNGTFLKSTNKGNTWGSLQVSGTPSNLFSVDHGDDQDEVYAVGENGFFVKSTDGGVSWTEIGTALQNASFYAVEASFTASGSVVACGSAGSVMVSADGGINQTYAVTKIGCLNIYVNGQEKPQDRIGDSEFEWDPAAQSWVFFGNYTDTGGATQLATVNATMATVIVYHRPPGTGSFTQRQLRTFQNAQLASLVSSEALKRIEFGDISPLVKTKSLWGNMKLFLCGPREPLQVYGWNAMLGLGDDVIHDLAIDKGNRLWLAMENGVCSFDMASAADDIERWQSGLPAINGPSDRFLNYNTLVDGIDVKHATCVTVDQNNNVWVGTPDGLYLLARAEESFSDSATTEDPVLSVRKTVDEESSNTAFGAGDILNASKPSISFVKLTVADGLPSNNILTVRSVNELVFVGTDFGLGIITVPKRDAPPSSLTDTTTTTDATTTDATTTTTETPLTADPNSFGGI